MAFRFGCQVKIQRVDPEDGKDDTDPIPVDLLTALAKDIEANVKAGNTVVIDVLASVVPTVAAVDPATVSLVMQPKQGTVVVNRDGTLSYTADKNASGVDLCSYRVKDVRGRWSNAGTIKLSILDNPLRIPNAFSPNNDNVNDRFIIAGLEAYDQINVRIMNRWGNEVYRNEHYKNEWDGAGLNAGTYYYYIEATRGGQKEVFKGSVLIKRN